MRGRILESLHVEPLPGPWRPRGTPGDEHVPQVRRIRSTTPHAATHADDGDGLEGTIASIVGGLMLAQHGPR